MNYQEFRDKTFNELVQRWLAWFRERDNDAQLGLGGLFRRAGLETVASGKLVDPPVEELKACLRSPLVWDVPVWPREEISYRISEVADCTLFAIALGDKAMMQELRAIWNMPPAESEWQEIAQLQLGLGLTGETPCTADYVSELFECDWLQEGNPAHQAWGALFRGDRDAARAALEVHRADLDARASRWSSTRGDEAYGILLVNTRILRLDARAIEAILARAAERG